MILITGGTGLVGSHLIVDLLKSGKVLKAIKRPNSDTSLIKNLFEWNNIDSDIYLKNLYWIDCDILDPVSVSDAFENITEVYHCAATVSFKASDRLKMMRFNIEGTANIVDASLRFGIKKLCHVSSVSAFGQAEENKTVNEETTRNSVSNFSGYSNSKYLSELEIWRGITEGLNAVIVNPTIILGAGNWKKSSARMFHESSKGMKFYTTGGSGFVDVRDVVSIIILLMTKEIYNQRFCINSENVSFRNVFSEISNNLNLKAPSIEAKKWMLQTGRFFEFAKSKLFNIEPRITKETIKSATSQTSYSNKKISELLNYKFIPISDSIKNTTRIFKLKH